MSELCVLLIADMLKVDNPWLIIHIDDKINIEFGDLDMFIFLDEAHKVGSRHNELL